MANEDYRPELPGSGGPPVNGRRWLWVKIVVWCIVALVVVGLALMAAGVGLLAIP